MKFLCRECEEWNLVFESQIPNSEACLRLTPQHFSIDPFCFTEYFLFELAIGVYEKWWWWLAKHHRIWSNSTAFEWLISMEWCYADNFVTEFQTPCSMFSKIVRLGILGFSNVLKFITEIMNIIQACCQHYAISRIYFTSLCQRHSTNLLQQHENIAENFHKIYEIKEILEMLEHIKCSRLTGDLQNSVHAGIFACRIGQKSSKFEF